MNPLRGPATRRPQLALDELHQLRWLLGGGLTLIALATVLYMEVDAWAVMALAVVGVMAALVQPTWPARIPGYVHTLAFPVIVGFFAADLWLRPEILPALVRLDILLLLYRAITYRRRRDDLQIVILGLFLVVVAGVLTVSILFALHLLLYAAGALALMLVITLTEAATAGKPAESVELQVVPAWAAQVRWGTLLGRIRAATDWRIVILGAGLFAGVVAVSALLFLAIPRFQLESSMFLDRLITKKAKSGFSDTIRFGDVTEIQQDNGLALSVDVSDQTRIPAAPYWRMLVLDEYANGTFRMSPALRGQEFGPERTQPYVRGDPRLLRPAEPGYWTFYLESGVSRYLPLLGRFGEVRFRDQQNARHAPNLAVVALREEPATMTAYRVEGFDLGGSLPDPAFAARWAARSLDQVPGAALQARLNLRDEELRSLAPVLAEITGGSQLAADEFAQRAGAWLRARHGYSLSPVIPAGDGDPLVRWLLSRNAGHCELFAGAMVVLARVSGYPARVITGFRGGSWNGYSNNFTIRNADAHAWAEIFDAGAGAWLRADALEAPRTDAQREAEAGAEAIAGRLDRSWKARLDSLRVFWYRRIVSFDQSSQAETLKAVKEATQVSGKRVREALQRLRDAAKDWVTSPWSVGRGLTVLTTVVALAALAWWVWTQGPRWWRRLRRTGGSRREDPVRDEAGRWLRRLREAQGIDEAETRQALERLRFGARETWSEPERVFRQARRLCRRARRRPVTPP